MGRLAVFLNCDRRTLVNYSHEDNFFPTIKRVRALIEADKNEALFEKDVPSAGVMFDMTNNYGWVNPQRVQVGGDPGNNTPITFVTKVPDGDKT